MVTTREIVERLRFLREQKNITQADVNAFLDHKDLKSYGSIERGTKALKFDEFFKILEFLQVSPMEFFMSLSRNNYQYDTENERNNFAEESESVYQTDPCAGLKARLSERIVTLKNEVERLELEVAL